MPFLNIFKALFMLVVFSTTAVAAEKQAQSYDPLQGFNRAMDHFNFQADRWVIKPLAKGYRAVTPDLVETGVNNFFSNLGDVRTLVNSALQFKGEQTATAFARLAFNTTFGLGGVLDVATPMGVVTRSEDLGQTLGYWGVPAGPYLVLPFLGPSSVRDALAKVPDGTTDPLGYVEHIPTRNTGYGMRLLDKRVQLFKAENLVAGDRYSFVRDAYLQRREYEVRDGQVELEFNSSDF